MPTVSKKQEKFMQAVANNPEFAKKVGVNQSIGQEFIKGKDMKKNYMYGGKVKKMNMGGRTGDMMYSRGYGAGKKDKRMPTELNMGGKVKKMAPGGLAKPGMPKVPATRKMPNDMKRMLDLRMLERQTQTEKLRNSPANRANIGARTGLAGSAGLGAAKGALQGMRVGMESGGKVKKQGYNARLDDSLGARKGKKKQSMKARRDESKGAKKAAGKKAYSGNRKSAQGSASKRADGIAQKGHTRGRMV